MKSELTAVMVFVEYFLSEVNFLMIDELIELSFIHCRLLICSAR